MKLKVLDLFSGIGGFTLGLERTGGFETVAFCEIDRFCRRILNRHWPGVTIYDDIRTIKNDFREPIDVICGGYPCQPFSVAGNRKGKEDDRHLWPEMFDCIKEYRPHWVIGENVANHANMGLDDVLHDLECAGYTTTTFNIPACAKDARHERQRLWIVAHAKSKWPRGCQHSSEEKGIEKHLYAQFNSRCSDVSDTKSKRVQGQWAGRFKEPSTHEWEEVLMRNFERGGFSKWEIEPGMGRMVDGVPNRAHRIKALGNAVVPQIPEMIGRAILEVERFYNGK